MLLVRTPRPYPTESLTGYLIRVTQSNGYDSMRTLYLLTGVDWRWKGRRDPGLDQLERILNLPPGYLQTIRTFKSGHARLGGWILGHPVSEDNMASSIPRICPDCIKELGFIEAHWELDLAVACARHQRMAVWSCQDCGEPLSLFRPRLLECHCGGDLASQAPRSASEGVLEFQSILRAVALRKCSPEDGSLGLPVADLMAMSLGALLATASRIGEYALSSSNRGDRRDGVEAVVESAAAAFANWPEGFHSLMRRGVYNQPAISSYSKKAGIMSVYGTLFCVLFKRPHPPQELEFLKRAFAGIQIQALNRSKGDARGADR